MLAWQWVAFGSIAGTVLALCTGITLQEVPQMNTPVYTPPTEVDIAAALKEWRKRNAAGCREWDAMEMALRAAERATPSR